MAVKYTIPFKAHDSTQWRINIATNAYAGNPNFVNGVSEQAAMLAYDANTTDDPFSELINSTLTINIYDANQIDVNELRHAQDTDFTVSLLRNGNVYWTGFLITDGISQPLQSKPYALSLQATDGLSMLTDIPYTHKDLPGGRTPINYIRQILFNKLGIILPIRWTNNLQCTAFPNIDVMAGSVKWGSDGQAFTSFQSGQSGDEPGPAYDCGYILSAILMSMQSRIHQSNGKWIIRRINEICAGIVIYKEITGDLLPLNIQTSTQNLVKQIGRTGYKFINEDQVVTTVPGLKSCQVTYTANVRDNILPNGNIDYVDADQNILYWKMFDTVGALADQTMASLDGRGGFSADLLNNNFVEDLYFSMYTDGVDLKAKGLPLDTQTLIAYIQFGFQFVLINGFPTLPDSTVIDWSSNPFQIQVVYNTNSHRYYLNEYGFWQTDEVFINITVDSLSLNDVAQIDFNAFQQIPMPLPDRQPQAGDKCNIQVLFVAKDNETYQLDNIYVNIAGGNDVYLSTLGTSKNTATDERELNISSSFNGYMLSNYMSSPFNSGDECFFKDEDAYLGTLTGLTANAIMRFRYKASDVFNGSISTLNGNWSFDEIYVIDSFAASKFLPLNATYNVEKCIVTGLVAMECRNGDDNPIFTETFFSSNDQQNSN